MPRKFQNRLTARFVTTIKQPGSYCDGGRLYLIVKGEKAKSWVWRYVAKSGKRTDLGLGGCPPIMLAQARERAAEAQRLFDSGVDPLDAKREERAKARAEAAKGMTFKECATAYIEAHKAGWRNPKHGAQWTATLETYAYPIFGDSPVAAIDVDQVMKALDPIWATKSETASRIRGRIESILDWATVRGYRQGDNPARWRGNLDHLLPAKGKVAKVEHFAALPYKETAPFMRDLRAREGNGARALEFAILTAARSGEVRGATWGEVDFAEKLWTLPAGRMKAGREHRSPLSDAALAILNAVKPAEAAPDSLIFPGTKSGSALSDMSLTAVLRRMGHDSLTVHGFRSAFRDWCAEETHFPREVAEAALAHVLKDKTEAAYRRGDALAKRRELMAAWAAYCEFPIASGAENGEATEKKDLQS